MQYNEFVGTETVYKEYKEISFQHVGIPYDDSTVDNYLRNFNWDFNDLIHQSIEKYIRIYLPKYICAFFDQHNKYKDSQSVLYFGIADNGLVKGIPYQGTLTVENIFTNETIDYLRNHIQSSDNRWLDGISVQLQEIDYKNDGIEDNTSTIHPKLKEYDQKKKMLNRSIRKHTRKYTKWQKKNEYYTQKLVELYYHPKVRKEFMQYLRHHGQEEMILRMKNGEIIEQKPYDEIRVYCDQRNNLYYWLCRWKDEMLEKIRSQKPIRERAYRNMLSHMETIYDPMRIFTNVSNMIPWWMDHNKEMKLYVIAFTFTHPSQPIEKIAYKERSGKWSTCFRSLNDKEQPCCIPYT